MTSCVCVPPLTPPVYWKMFIRCVALPGLTEESWTVDTMKMLDEFISDATISILVIYLDADAKLRAHYCIPSPVGHTFLY